MGNGADGVAMVPVLEPVGEVPKVGKDHVVPLFTEGRLALDHQQTQLYAIRTVVLVGIYGMKK